MDLTRGVTYNGLQLNVANYSPGGSPASGYRIDHFDPSQVDVSAFLDKRGQRDGLDASDVFLGGRHLGLIVTAYGSTRGDLWDKEQGLLAAFMPTLAYNADSANLGFLPLAFSQPTANTSSWPGGVIPVQFYARAMSGPPYTYDRDTDGGRDGKGGSKQFRLQLICRDPRKYTQTATSATIGTSTATATNRGDYPTEPTLTIVSASTTGALTFTVAGSSFTATIDATSTTYILDSSATTFYKAGVSRPDLITANVVYPTLSPGANTHVRGSLTGVTVTMSYRDAFA